MRNIQRIREFQRVEKSFEIAWAGMLALHLALTGKRPAIRVEDYFSGAYLIGRDALVPFWRDSAELDGFVRSACELTEPAWYYWIEFHHAMKTEYAEGVGATYSRELANILNYAAHLLLRMKRKSKRKPELRIEHLMAALAANRKLKFTRRLLASGFDIHKLNIGA